jgi:hypothetical protein
VLLGATWVQASALRLPFFADDYLFLDQVRGRPLWAALTSPDPLRNFWRPVGRQAYFWLVAQCGESPLVAHLLNLLLFLGIVAMLFTLASRLAGRRAAVIAAAIIALHYGADVPVRWASGSQDLIAVAGALGALCLVASGRSGWAAIPLGLGLLAKETVVLTPLVAWWMVLRPGEPWTRAARRVWPLGAAVGVWGALWMLAMHGRSGGTIHFSADAFPAAPVHLLQVFLGAEWDPHQPRFFAVFPPLVPLVLVLVAIALAFRGRAAGSPRGPAAGPPASRAWSTGLVWAALATAPVVLVVHIWSAYYYLFALCGMALMVGALLERRAVVLTLALVALLGWGSENARRLETFATDPSPWLTESHLNRFYFDRSMKWVARYLEDLRRQRPTLPHRSTLFFAGVQTFASWQAADGPLVRWAYRDSSLRSYYLHAFSAERAHRGPFFLFSVRNDSLLEEPEGPDPLWHLTIAQLLDGHYEVARDAITIARERYPRDTTFAYCAAWVSLALGDSAAASRNFRGAGCTLRGGPTEDMASVRRLLAAADTIAAVRVLQARMPGHILDPEPHSLLADLWVPQGLRSVNPVIEAFAARLLEPRNPLAWRRWAVVQMQQWHFQEAYVSMRRYFDLAGPAGASDAEALRALEFLHRALPGGELAQQELRRRPRARS